MMHTNRCSSCAFLQAATKEHPAGLCTFNGVSLNLTPEIRRWVELHGCCVYRRPTLIDAETLQAAHQISQADAGIQSSPFADEPDPAVQ